VAYIGSESVSADAPHEMHANTDSESTVCSEVFKSSDKCS